MSEGEGKVYREFMVNVSHPHSPCPIHPAHTWQQVLPGCEGTPTQCIWISHTCPVSSAGHRWRNKPTWAKSRGESSRERACCKTAGCWCLFHCCFLFRWLSNLSTSCQFYMFFFTICTLQGDHKLHLQVYKNVSGFCLILPVFFTLWDFLVSCTKPWLKAQSCWKTTIKVEKSRNLQRLHKWLTHWIFWCFWFIFNKPKQIQSDLNTSSLCLFIWMISKLFIQH